MNYFRAYITQRGGEAPRFPALLLSAPGDAFIRPTCIHFKGSFPSWEQFGSKQCKVMIIRITWGAAEVNELPAWDIWCPCCSGAPALAGAGAVRSLSQGTGTCAAMGAGARHVPAANPTVGILWKPRAGISDIFCSSFVLGLRSTKGLF